MGTGSSPDLASLLDNCKELDRIRKEEEEIIAEINKLHKKLQITPEIVEKPGDTSLSRLKTLYVHAKELSELEVSVSSALLSQLDALLPSGPPGQQRRRMEGNEQKKKRKPESDIPRVSPSMRNQLDNCANLKGEQVAARVTTEEADKDEYIVVKVIHFDRENREFEVLDEEPGDDEEGGGQRKYKLPMSHIIPFPKRSDPSSAQDFVSGKAVLAVYPGTTALYKATVVNSRKPYQKDIATVGWLLGVVQSNHKAGQGREAINNECDCLSVMVVEEETYWNGISRGSCNTDKEHLTPSCALYSAATE
ncbi:hypothetical protein V2J09_021163 [Rumex salicifolius]